jgi:hypothetical protein
MNTRTTTFAWMITVLTLAAVASAADRQWQTGRWTKVETKRQMIDFGPSGTPFGGGTSTAAMRAMADVNTYVLETDDLRLELQDTVPVGRRSIAAAVGTTVTFALEKDNIYVRDTDGTEHKIHVTKKVTKVRS